ncbi:MAG: helix-turn-helix transcriptional regulator [Eubacteriales bacterium]|nr:helix-turn-helix transcriptional regulator [Eubacteriales bacterium]
MGRRSTRENKNIYQLLREEQELTRREASDRMTGISPARLEKFEYETQIPEPYDVVQMAEAYHRPDLCNYYCSHECAIGHKYVPEVALSDLPDIILETIAGLNALTPLTGRLIQIARDGKITDDEIHDFAAISAKLDEISLAIDTLNLWVDKTAGENQLNLELLNEEKKKLRGR